MQQLKERILRDGKCFEGGILKVDNFINHQMDPILMKSMAGVRAPFRVARYKQDTDDRSQWHSSGHHGGLPLGTSGGLCQEEETEYDGKYAGDESLFVY